MARGAAKRWRASAVRARSFATTEACVRRRARGPGRGAAREPSLSASAGDDEIAVRMLAVPVNPSI